MGSWKAAGTWETSRAETRYSVAAKQSWVKRMRGTMGNSAHPKTPVHSCRPAQQAQQLVGERLGLQQPMQRRHVRGLMRKHAA